MARPFVNCTRVTTPWSTPRRSRGFVALGRQDKPLHLPVISHDGGVDAVGPQARDSEWHLHDDGATDQKAHLQPHYRHRGDQGVLQRMFADDELPLPGPWGGWR
jgi:hypothetical protein